MKDYAIIKIEDLELIDFAQVNQTKETIRKDLTQTKFIIKWVNNNTPTFITDKSVIPLELLSHSEILQYLEDNSIDWNEPLI